MDDESPLVIVCKGPPDCLFTDDEAVAAANAGCPSCKRIIINSDGTETEYQVKAQ